MSINRPPASKLRVESDRRRWAPLLVGLLLLAAYLPAIFGRFIWDDDQYVTENANLRTAAGLKQIWTEPGTSPQYYPLVFTSFWIEYQVWRLWPAGYHLVNILLHAAGAWLLWRVLLRLNIPHAGWAAAFFALHPVHVESVAWITERKNVLSGVFYLSSLLAYLSFSGLPQPQDPTRKRWRFYALSIALFACALLSKSVTASLPAVIFLLLWWKRDRLRPRDILPLLPLFLMGAAMGLFTAWMEKHHVGAANVDWGLTFADRLLIAGRAIWFYLGKLLWPRPLIFTYPRWQIDSASILQWLFPIAAISLLAALWLLRRRIGKAPLLAALFFAGTLFPVFGFLDVYPMIFSYVADHFQYLASIAPLALAAALLFRIIPKTFRHPGLIPAGLLLILASLTFQHAHAFFDSQTLWEDTLRKNPYAWSAHLNLGVILERQGKTVDALHHFEKALELAPSKAVAQVNLGAALFKLGRPDEAIAHHRAALAERPHYWFAHFNLGSILSELHRPEEAAASFRAALKLRPDSAPTLYNLGVLAHDAGRLDEAIDLYQRSLAIEPTLTRAHYRLATAYWSRQDASAAIRHLREVLHRQPAHADAQALLRKIEGATSQPAE